MQNTIVFFCHHAYNYGVAIHQARLGGIAVNYESEWFIEAGGVPAMPST